jgi:hypothetical protein
LNVVRIQFLTFSDCTWETDSNAIIMEPSGRYSVSCASETILISVNPIVHAVCEEQMYLTKFGDEATGWTTGIQF